MSRQSGCVFKALQKQHDGAVRRDAVPQAFHTAAPSGNSSFIHSGSGVAKETLGRVGYWLSCIQAAWIIAHTHTHHGAQQQKSDACCCKLQLKTRAAD